MQESNDILNEKQIRAINFIIKGMSITDIAIELGVSRHAIYEWKKKESFKAELNRRLQELKNEVNNEILNNIKPITSRLVKIALKSSSDKTSLDACIYAINRLCGTPTNKTQEVGDQQQSEGNVDISSILEEIKSENNNSEMAEPIDMTRFKAQ